MKEPSSKKSNIIILIIISVFSLSYISLIFNNNLWTDEAYTIQLVSENSIIDIIKGTANDVHPPLYYIITKIAVTIFGSSIQIYKIVSIIPMILTLFISFVLIKKWFGFYASILFILFINAIPCVLEYVVQIRMYSWSIFFITLAALSAYGAFCYSDNKYYILLLISTICSCYIHNFAMISNFFIFIALGIALFIPHKKFPTKWLVCGITISILYLPWLIVLYKQTTSRVGNYWIAPVTLNTILYYPNDIFGSRIPYSTAMFIILCILAIAINIVKSLMNHERTATFSLLLVLIPILTATIGITVSIMVTPFFIARYLVPCMGILALFFAISFSNENYPTFCILCIFLVIMFGNSYYTNYIDEYKSTHTQELLDYMYENMTENDTIIYNYEIYGFIYECYFDKDKLTYIGDFDFNSDYDNIWFFDSCNDVGISDMTLEEYNLTEEYIDSSGIEQNDFILYKISHQ